jgi:hypothetical protein
MTKYIVTRGRRGTFRKHHVATGRDHLLLRVLLTSLRQWRKDGEFTRCFDALTLEGLKETGIFFNR